MYVKSEISGLVFDVEIETSAPRVDKVSMTVGSEIIDFTQLFADNDLDNYILDKHEKEIRKQDEQEKREHKSDGIR